MAILNSIYATFYDSKFDKEHGYPEYGEQPLDYHYEKVHYGKVDRRQNAVYLSDVNLTSQLVPGEPHMALDFVAEAFREFSEHFQKALTACLVAREGIFKDGLVAVNALTDLDQLYEIYKQNLYEILETFLFSSKKNKELKSFNDFLRFFREFVDSYAHTTPITRTAFIKSRLAPRNISGLFIELKGGQYDNNEVKEQWVEDVNFDFYRNTAAKFGFLIDKSAPWCLVANVASYEMQNRWFERVFPTLEQMKEARAANLTEKEIFQAYTDVVSKRGLVSSPGDASNLFEVYYTKSYLQDLDELTTTLIEFYNKFVATYPVVKIYKPVLFKKMNKCGAAMIKVHERFGIDFETASNTFRPLSRSMYLLCRIREEELEVSELKQNQILQKAKFLEKNLDKTKALRYINSEIKKQISLKVNPSHCQNFKVCGESVKTKEEVQHRKYVKSPLI